MCDQSIHCRRLDERHDIDQQRYQELVDEIEAQQRAEYEAQFGPTYRAKHQFRPRGVHDLVMQRMREESINA